MSRRPVPPSSPTPSPKILSTSSPSVTRFGICVPTDPAGRVRGTEIDSAQRNGCFELYVHVLEPHVRLAQEVESLEDDDDGVSAVTMAGMILPAISVRVLITGERSDTGESTLSFPPRLALNVICRRTQAGGSRHEIERVVVILVK